MDTSVSVPADALLAVTVDDAKVTVNALVAWL
jgi:hypothetical protein